MRHFFVFVFLGAIVGSSSIGCRDRSNVKSSELPLPHRRELRVGSGSGFPDQNITAFDRVLIGAGPAVSGQALTVGGIASTWRAYYGCESGCSWLDST